MKNNLKNIFNSCVDPKRIRARINDGKSDLLGALPNSNPISFEQKEDIKKFWKPYVNTFVERKSFDIRWFDVYNRTNIYEEPLKWYIPDSYFYAVVDTFFNDALRCKYMDDKNLYDLYFHDVNQAKTICRKENGDFLDNNYHIITKSKAMDLCINSGGVILKPSVEACARSGIRKWENGENGEKELEVLLNSKGPFIVQELIRQHKSLAMFNNTCVNTMRIVTLALGNTVNVITAVVIMGGKGAYTNHLHGGGLICGINKDGSLRSYAFDGKLNQYDRHPCGPVFAECSIFNYQKCVDLVVELAPRLFGMSRLAAWDITLDEYGEPLLIEVNLNWGGVVQKAAGPMFGERTEEVLNYIHQKRI